MTVRELITQGLYYARTCRSLWLFGFFAGLASGGSNGGGGGKGGGAALGGVGSGFSFLDLSTTQVGAIAGVLLLMVAVLILMRFVSEAALIEGVVRARRGASMTTGEGFRAGWAHWGVLVRIALIFFGAMVGSIALLVVPCVIAMRAFGPIGALLFAIPAVIIAVPWLVTLFMVQAFAWRIAVLENRRTFDAIGKARLFLHGRLLLGLKLIVATFVGTLLLGFFALAALVPVALVLVALIPLLEFFPVLIIGCALLLPAFVVFTAIVGTFRSSVWTLGYVTQVES